MTRDAFSKALPLNQGQNGRQFLIGLSCLYTYTLACGGKNILRSPAPNTESLVPSSLLEDEDALRICGCVRCYSLRTCYSFGHPRVNSHDTVMKQMQHTVSIFFSLGCNLQKAELPACRICRSITFAALPHHCLRPRTQRDRPYRPTKINQIITRRAKMSCLFVQSSQIAHQPEPVSVLAPRAPAAS